MLPHIRRASFALLLALLAMPSASLPCKAQFRDALMPKAGEMWLEIQPALFNWSEQFAYNPVDGSVANGHREPLFSHYDGSLARRLFPPLNHLVDALNDDAETLGFDPLKNDDFSFGSLDFSVMRAQVRQVALGFEFGVLDRASVGFSAPFVLTDMTTAFTFDSTTATVTRLGRRDVSVFLPDALIALNTLRVRIARGEIPGPQIADAIDLRDDTDAFLAALSRLVRNSALIPTAPSAAGRQMLARLAGLASAFEALDLELPELILRSNSGMADFDEIFADTTLADILPENTRLSLNVGEIEVFSRVKLIDQITRRAPGLPENGYPAIRYRAAAGVLGRIPVRSRNVTLFGDPANSADLPMADGQIDVEISLYQDVALGKSLKITAVGRYGIQLPDRAVLRVAPPDRPYASSLVQAFVDRDLGDYFKLLIRSAVKINPALSLGFEYDYFELGNPTYKLAGEYPDVEDVSVLAIQGSQSRHEIGFGFVIDLSEARLPGEENQDILPVRNPWRFVASLRRATAGSGGRTPAWLRFEAGFRAPVDVFGIFGA